VSFPEFHNSAHPRIIIPPQTFATAATLSYAAATAATSSGTPVLTTLTEFSSPIQGAAASSTLGTNPTTTASSSSSVAGPIAGGVVGGVAVLGAVAGLLFYYLRRQPKATVAAYRPGEEGPGPEKSEISSDGPGLRYLDSSGVQEINSGNLRGNY
jgi:hypothetical protein